MSIWGFSVHAVMWTDYLPFVGKHKSGGIEKTVNALFLVWGILFLVFSALLATNLQDLKGDYRDALQATSFAEFDTTDKSVLKTAGAACTGSKFINQLSCNFNKTIDANPECFKEDEDVVKRKVTESLKRASLHDNKPYLKRSERRKRLGEVYGALITHADFDAEGCDTNKQNAVKKNRPRTIHYYF